MAEERLTEHVLRHSTGELWWLDIDERGRGSYSCGPEETYKCADELAQVLLTERRRVERLRAALGSLMDRLGAVRVIACVEADGPDDPRARNGVLLYRIELSNGEWQDLQALREDEEGGRDG